MCKGGSRPPLTKSPFPSRLDLAPHTTTAYAADMPHRLRRIAAVALSLAPFVAARTQPIAPNTTFANPIDIDYRFMPDGVSRREAADPSIVPFGDDYYLFASKSGGYYRSRNLRDWTLIESRGYDAEAYAPAVVVIGGRMYYTAHKLKAVYTTDDPRTGTWRKVTDIGEYADPDFFLDDDGRLYLYFGSSLNGGISGVELDPKTFAVLAGPKLLMKANYADHGWERSGADNLGAQMTEGFRIGPYVEGSWMTKHGSTYYLQYAAPGTVWKTYADGVYTASSPLGEYAYAPYSPFSYKPGGFVGGAGHSGMFQDKRGNYWRVTTMIVSVAHKFERRLGILPAGFDADGVLRTNTYLGDYPQLLPGIARDPLGSNRTPWMLLSDGRAAAASSTLESHPASDAFDEDIRTQWSARTGNPGEWLRVDLGAPSEVHAVQINLGEVQTTAHDRIQPLFQQYVVESSLDGRTWTTLVDRRANTLDRPHTYVQLDAPKRARYVRVTNVRAAAGGMFAVRDLRVFGIGAESAPAPVTNVRVVRDSADSRDATISWTKARGARRYVVRFGIAREKLYSSYELGDVDTLTLHALNRGVPYFFAVDAINSRGVTRGTVLGAM